MGFPNLPGVPPLSNLNNRALAGVVTEAAPLLNNLLDKLKKGWNIVDAITLKTDVIKPDSFLSIDFHNEYNIPNAPQEQGAFTSYNKVPTPFTAIVKVAKGAQLNPLSAFGGGGANLKSFLDNLLKINGDTKLYAVVTPDQTHLNVNLKGVDYKREVHNGAAMILATLTFVEVMQQANVSAPPAPPTTVAPNSGSCPKSAFASINLGGCQALGVTTLSKAALMLVKFK